MKKASWKRLRRSSKDGVNNLRNVCQSTIAGFYSKYNKRKYWKSLHVRSKTTLNYRLQPTLWLRVKRGPACIHDPTPSPTENVWRIMKKEKQPWRHQTGKNTSDVSSKKIKIISLSKPQSPKQRVLTLKCDVTQWWSCSTRFRMNECIFIVSLCYIHFSIDQNSFATTSEDTLNRFNNTALQQEHKQHADVILDCFTH